VKSQGVGGKQSRGHTRIRRVSTYGIDVSVVPGGEGGREGGAEERGAWKEGASTKWSRGGPSKGKMPFLTLAAEGRAERQRRLRNAGARIALLAAGGVVMKGGPC
jgi:hypothetical protein